MNARSILGVIAIVLIAAIAFGMRLYSDVQKTGHDTAAEQQLAQEHKDKMRAVLDGVRTNPRLKDAAKDLKIDAAYIDSVFDDVHKEAWRASVSRGYSISVDEFLYRTTFFKTLSARAVKDHKNELSGSIDRIALYIPRTAPTGAAPKRP